MQTAWRSKAGVQFQVEKRPVTGSRGVVAANHPLGSSAGAEMLAAGGNAIDAAIATLFALTVVEPMMVGIFGAGHMNIRMADGRHVALDGYSTAPLAATPDMFTPLHASGPDYLQVRDRLNTVGPLAVGVPGTLKGWREALDQYGTMSLDEVMQPAIRLAEHGFRATGYLSEVISTSTADLSKFPETAKTWMPGGRPLERGTLVRQPEYARTLRAISDQGIDALYDGPIGHLVCDYLKRRGGIITPADLREYKTVTREPVRGTYRGYEVVGVAPPSAGGVHLIEALNILESFDVSELGFGTADGVHLLAETMRLVFEDRDRYTGDPAFFETPVDMLLSKGHAEQRRYELSMERTNDVASAPAGSLESHTTHVTAVDGDGNIAAMTQTINDTFGSKMTVPGTGILLNNTMSIFDPHPGHARSIAPGKRMTSSMAPTIVLKDGIPEFAVGLPGGVRIFTSVLQAVINVIDHGMTPQEAVEAPRMWSMGDSLELEPAFGDDIADALTQRGHRIDRVNTVGGGMNMVRFEPGGMLSGASCWRADGSPVALGGGMARPGIRFRTQAGQEPTE